MKDRLVEASLETIRSSVLWASTVAKYVGIQPTDLFAIAHLLASETATAGELMEITNLTSGATTAMINRLVSAGIVVRESDAEDGRLVVVRLVAPPPSVEFVQTVTSQEIRKAATQHSKASADDWLSVHAATVVGVRRAIERLGPELRSSSRPPKQGRSK